MTNKIKGVRKLNDKVSKTLAPFGITRAKVGDTYMYQFTDATVGFKITENTLEDRWFIEFVKERFNYNVRYPFIFSLLHEVGHHKANDEIEGAIYDFCTAEKERIEAALAKDNISEKKAKKIEWQYFSLPDEIMATQWAVDYCRKHPKKIKEMWEQCQTAFYEFYKANGIADNELM
jgi:hypothetical protein